MTLPTSNPLSTESALDARELIDARPIGHGQIVAYVLIFLTLALDGLDAQSMSYVGLNIAKEFHISMSSLGSIFSLGLVGTTIGAFTLGTLGDVFGLKRIIVSVTALISLATLGLGLSTSLTMVAICRVVIGIGVGGALPNLIALASQYSPSRRRATIVTLTGAGFPTGAALGGFLTAGVLSQYGWRMVFTVAGSAPLLLTVLLILFLPESIPKLLKCRDGQGRAGKVLMRLYPKDAMRETILWSHKAVANARLPIIDLFRGGRARLTALLSVASFMSLLDVYLLSNWLPGLMQQAHASSNNSVLATTGYNIGGIFGAILFGRLMDRFGFVKVLAPAYFIGALFLTLLAFGHFSFNMLVVVTFFSGMFTIGNQGSLNALPALFFPDTIRATGTGWVSAVGRIGSFLGPLLVGGLLAAHWDHAHILFVAALPAALTACALISIYALGLGKSWKVS